MGPFDRFDHRAKRAFAMAQDEAIRFDHNYIGVEHLLLGLLREREGMAARVMVALGLDLPKARTGVESIIGRGGSTASPAEITLTPRLKKVIEMGIDEAQKLRHQDVAPEHLLLAIVREAGSVAAVIIESNGLSLEKVRAEVLKRLGEGPTAPGATSPA